MTDDCGFWEGLAGASPPANPSPPQCYIEHCHSERSEESSKNNRTKNILLYKLLTII